MPPKKVDAAKDGPVTDWTEFRQTLMAMHEDLQRTLQQSILELGETLLHRLPAQNPRLEEKEADDDRNPFANRRRLVENDNYDHRALRAPRAGNTESRWESGFKVKIPEFHGGGRGDVLLDWMVSVEEVLDFKQVPEDRRVPLVAMRFRGHAASWWKQLKTTRSRTGRTPIQTWEKLKKHLRATFLPHNYDRVTYNKLQNLKQGSRSVEEYADEFSLLLTRTEVFDSEDQLVSRFIGGLRPQLQTALAQFDPITIAEAQSRAMAFEQQNKASSSNWNSSSSKNRFSDSTATTTLPSKDAETSNTNQKSSATPDDQNLRRSTRIPAIKCFSCGEQGHRQAACPHQQRRGLLAEEAKTDENAVYDSYEEDEEETDAAILPQDKTARMLVVRRSCIVPRRQDDKWLRTNIFRSTCVIKDRTCTYVIDSGSCRNMIAQDAVSKLGLVC